MDEQRTRNEKPRAYARRIAEQGVGLLAHALNACAMPERTYRYDDTTQDRFRALMFEVVQIVGTDKIIERRSAAAQADIGLQRIPCIRISQKTRVASSARSSISNRRRRCAFVGKAGVEGVLIDAGTGKVLSIEHETAANEAAEKAVDKVKK